MHIYKIRELEKPSLRSLSILIHNIVRFKREDYMNSNKLYFVNLNLLVIYVAIKSLTGILSISTNVSWTHFIDYHVASNLFFPSIGIISLF